MPGEEFIWVIVMGEILVFSMAFCLFFYYRSTDLELFRESKAMLNLHYGLTNTVLLLISSRLVVSSIEAFRQRQLKRCKRSMGLAILCGLGFIALKYFEYAGNYHVGVTPEVNDFFLLYYLLTGVHLVHVVIGVAVLLSFILFLQRMQFSGISERTMESGATYWHMVDLVWVLMFPILYLLP